MANPVSRSSVVLADTVRRVLASRGLTLAEVSRRSLAASSTGRLHHIQHNVYDAIRTRAFNPSVYQLLTLSLLSGYRFVDWLELFGFSLDEIVRFQCGFSALRTVELDSRIYHSGTRIPWFRDLAMPVLISECPLTPLSQWLVSSSAQRIESLLPPTRSAFRFIKIGLHDAYAFPDLLPGSIVRIDRRKEGRLPVHHQRTRGVFLIQNGHRLWCSGIYSGARKQVLVCSRHLPYPLLELDREETSLLGSADIEFRRIVEGETPVVPKDLGDYRAEPTPPSSPLSHKMGDFLRQARRRAGLSFREASKRTRVIARALKDSRYFCASGSLSDYETRAFAPRHVHKVIALCAVYFVSAKPFLRSAGVEIDSLGQLPMPAEFLEGARARETVDPARYPSQQMNQFSRRFEELPFFLHNAMPAFFGIPNLSVRDIFWAGGVRRFTHRYLANSEFLVVDRRKKKAASSLARPKWAQPLYVFLRRDGTYMCGSYRRRDGILIINLCEAGLPKLLKLRDQLDVEVIGQVVGIIRSLK